MTYEFTNRLWNEWIPSQSRPRELTTTPESIVPSSTSQIILDFVDYGIWCHFMIMINHNNFQFSTFAENADQMKSGTPIVVKQYTFRYLCEGKMS